MSLSQMINLFKIQCDKTEPLISEIFHPFYEIFQKQVEELYKENIKVLKIEDIYRGFNFDGNTFYRDIENTKYLYLKGTTSIDKSLINKAIALLELRDNVRKDIRFLQMWMSTFYNSYDPEETKRYLPSILNNFYPFSDVCTKSKIIPEGKESLWKKAEEIISYYIGLRLIL